MSSALSQTPSSTNDFCRDRILHLIAMLFAELDDVAPGILPPGTSLSVPSGPLPLPTEDEDPAPPTSACSGCGHLNNPGLHNPQKWYAMTKGWAVGVIQGCSDQLSLTTGVPGGLSSKGGTKTEATQLFNDALSKTQVIVVPKVLKF